MNKKILIIDDEQDIMKVVVYRLEAKGYTVLTAETGEQGVKAGKEEKPDLIILDYWLPDMDAKDVAEKIRSHEGMGQVPIVLITASVEDLETKAKECNANDFLPKPIDPEELYKKVGKYI